MKISRKQKRIFFILVFIIGLLTTTQTASATLPTIGHDCKEKGLSEESYFAMVRDSSYFSDITTWKKPLTFTKCFDYDVGLGGGITVWATYYLPETASSYGISYKVEDTFGVSPVVKSKSYSMYKPSAIAALAERYPAVTDALSRLPKPEGSIANGIVRYYTIQKAPRWEIAFDSQKNRIREYYFEGGVNPALFPELSRGKRALQQSSLPPECKAVDFTKETVRGYDSDVHNTADWQIDLLSVGKNGCPFEISVYAQENGSTTVRHRVPKKTLYPETNSFIYVAGGICLLAVILVSLLVLRKKQRAH